LKKERTNSKNSIEDYKRVDYPYINNISSSKHGENENQIPNSINHFKYRNRLHLKKDRIKLKTKNRYLDVHLRETKFFKNQENESFIQGENIKDVDCLFETSFKDKNNTYNLNNYRNSKYQESINFINEPGHSNGLNKNNSIKMNNFMENDQNITNRNNNSLINLGNNESLIFKENHIIKLNNTSNIFFNKTNNNNTDNFDVSINNVIKSNCSYKYSKNHNEVNKKKKSKYKSAEHFIKNRELHDYFLNSNRPLIQMDICEQIKFVIKQFELYLQMILQNIFLTDNMDLKYRGYSLIYNMYMQKTRIINLYRLPHFEIYFNFCKVKNYLLFFLIKN
jgi:hypothetical protein